MTPKEELENLFDKLKIDARAIYDRANLDKVDPKIPTKDTPIGTKVKFWDTERDMGLCGFWIGLNNSDEYPFNTFSATKGFTAPSCYRFCEIIED